MEARAVWFTRPRHAELKPAEVRPCGDGDIVVKALASGISHGTEMIIYRGEGPAEQELSEGRYRAHNETAEGSILLPVKYGYQSVGRVMEAGAKTGFQQGDLVFVRFPHQDVYTVRVDPNLVYKLPNYETPEIGIFGNLLDVAVNAMLDVPVRLGDVVAVFGQGVVGMFSGQLARRTAGKLVVVDPIPFRRELALRFGADAAVDPKDAFDAIMELSQGRGADVTIEASGSPPALQSAIKCTGFEGTVVVVSWYGANSVSLMLAPDFHIGRMRLVSSQVNVIGSGLQPRWDVTRRMNVVMDLLPTLHPEEMITHRFPFESAPEAYKLIDEHPEQVLAVMLVYSRE